MSYSHSIRKQVKTKKAYYIELYRIYDIINTYEAKLSSFAADAFIISLVKQTGAAACNYT